MVFSTVGWSDERLAEYKELQRRNALGWKCPERIKEIHRQNMLGVRKGIKHTESRKTLISQGVLFSQGQLFARTKLRGKFTNPWKVTVRKSRNLKQLPVQLHLWAAADIKYVQMPLMFRG
jgi:hypothetical protein